MADEIGFLTVAFGGRRHIEQARTLAASLRIHMPGHPLAIVGDRKVEGFDHFVPYDASVPAPFVHKILLDRYSPFAKALFIDSDCVALRPFETELGEIAAHGFSPVVEQYRVAGDHDDYLADVGAALAAVGGTRFPKYNGGVYYFDDTARPVFEAARAILERKDEIGILDFGKRGPGDETIIGLALASLGMTDLYDDGGRLMRTPLGARFDFPVDPLSGKGVSFVKNGKAVSPALLHFSGVYYQSRQYRFAQRQLRHQDRSPLRAVVDHAVVGAERLALKVRKKVGW